jgi:drug/metabolite transporter (DMT)-like permease
LARPLRFLSFPLSNLHSRSRRGSGATVSVVAAATFTVIVWGSTYTAIRVAVRSFPPGPLALCRFGIGSLTVAILALIAARRTPLTRPTLREAAVLIAAGLFGVAVYSVLVNAGERTVTAGTTGLLLSASPVMVALLAIPVLGERLNQRAWGGVALGFVGTALIAASDASGIRLGPGVPTVLLAAFSWAIYSVIQKALLGRFTPLEVIAYSFWAGTAALTPFAHRLVMAWHGATPAACVAVVYLGVVPAGVGYLTWAYMCDHMEASRAAATGYLIAPIGLLVAWVTLGEIPRPAAVLGGLLTMVGVAIVHWARPRAVRDGLELPEPL